MKKPKNICMAVAMRIAILLVMLGGVGATAWAQSSTENFYAVYNPTDKLLTFKKCVRLDTDGNTYYSVYYYDSFKQWTWDNIKRKVEKVTIDESFKENHLSTCKYFFSGFSVLTSIEGLDNLETSGVTDMSYMFSSCAKLGALDLSGLNTSNVTDMSYMFSSCTKLGTLDLSGFDTKDVTNMSRMFSGCQNLATVIFPSKIETSKVTSMEGMFNYCQKLESLDLSGFDTRNVTAMNSMFFMCSVLRTLNLSGFDTAKVSNMSYMFYGCESMGDFTFPDKFTTSNVKSMYAMFQDCKGISSLDFSNFDTGKVADMSYLFYNCSNLLDIKFGGKFSTASVKKMENMFGECTILKSLDLSCFDTQNVTAMNSMFAGCKALEEIDLTNFVTPNLVDMGAMFSDCVNLLSVKMPKIITSNVTDMRWMFSGCYKITDIDLSNFDTHSVTNMFSMFAYCKSLSKIYVSGFNTEKVENMGSMFYYCQKLENLDLSSFATPKLNDMSSMFEYCENLKSLNLSNFNTAGVKIMYRLFSGCSSLVSLDLTGFNTGGTNNLEYMFSRCSGLVSLDLSSFNTDGVTNMNSMFSGCANLETIYVSDMFTTDNVTSSGYMFKGCEKMPNYNSSAVGVAMANYHTGYFKTYYKNGNGIQPLYGENLTVDNLMLKDGDDFIAHAPFTAATATYARTMKNEWGTLCLPYAVNTADIDGCEFYGMADISDDVLTVGRIDGIVAAGQPVVIRRTADTAADITFAATDAAIVKAPVAGDAAANSLVGTFTAMKVPDNCYAIAANKFWLVDEVATGGKEVWSSGFRSYIQPAMQTVGQAMPMALSIGGSTTGIGSVETGNTATDVLNAAASGKAEMFDASGRRIGQLQKGLNIVRLGSKTQKVYIK